MQKKSPKKGVIYVENSIFNCVYYKRHKCRMSTQLHAVFNVVSGKVNFLIVISNNRCQKMRFFESSQNSSPEKSIFGQFEVIFLNVWFFSRAGCVFLLVYSKRSILMKKWALWLVSKKVIKFSAKIPILAIFDYLGPPSKSIFSTYSQNFRKPLVTLLGEVVRNIVLIFEFSIFKKVRGG